MKKLRLAVTLAVTLALSGAAQAASCGWFQRECNIWSNGILYSWCCSVFDTCGQQATSSGSTICLSNFIACCD